MAPFISETFNLSPAQKGLMLSVPIIAGALMRFPLGLLSQYIGRKNATLVEMGLIAVAMLFGFFFVKSFNDLLAMGVLLGIAGASFGMALSLGSALRVFGGWISDRWGGINTLTVVLVTVAVTLTLCGLAGASLVATTLLVMLCFAALGAGNGALFQRCRCAGRWPRRWPAP